MSKIYYSNITAAKYSEYSDIFTKKYVETKRTYKYRVESVLMWIINVNGLLMIGAFLAFGFRPLFRIIYEYYTSHYANENVFKNILLSLILCMLISGLIIFTLLKIVMKIEMKLAPLHRQIMNLDSARADLWKNIPILEFEEFLKKDSVQLMTDDLRTLTASWQDKSGIYHKKTVNLGDLYGEIVTKEGLDFTCIDRKIDEISKQYNFSEFVLEKEEKRDMK